MISRRTFIKAGIAGSVVLAGAGWFALGGRKEAPAGAAMLAAVAGSILAGVLPTDPDARQRTVEEVVAGVRRIVAGLAPPTQREIGELFALLDFAPARMLLAGVRPAWSDATDAELAAFLEGWRFSRFMLLQSAYAALHDLLLGAWYARPGSWARIGYPGPPEVPEVQQ